MRNLAVIAAALGLAACSSSPASLSQARPVDQANVFAPELQSASLDRTVPVRLVRDSGFMGKVFNAIVVVDGKNTVALEPNEQFELYLAPGDHLFSVRSGSDPLSKPMAETHMEIRQDGPRRIDLRLIKTEGPRITWALQAHD
jgi:hypothetical protein